MNTWLKNAIDSLLPLSFEKEDFNKAVKEWSFTGETIDFELADEICQLCKMEGLRYHYQIANALNNKLWVGSKCIDRFDIQVFDLNGEEVSKKEKEAYLKNQLKDKHIHEVLVSLSARPSEEPMNGFQKFYLDRYCFAQLHKSQGNARILNYLFIRLDEEKIYYNKRFFAIDIRSKLNKEKLLLLNETQFERIRGALSNSQLSFYKQNRK